MMEVTLSGVTKKFGSFEALKDVTLQIDGGMFGLLGPNGAGKSTLMKIITALIAPTAGQVTVGGIDVVRRPDQVRHHLGYLPQEFGFYKNLNAYQILTYVATMKNVPARQTRRQVEAVLEQVNLKDAARRKVGGYSGGMKQRLGIAQALLGNPDLLVVDEPTAGLDPEERIRLRNMLARLAEERTVILSTHIVADVEASCSGLAVLRKGGVAFAGTLDQLRSQAHNQVWELEVTESEWEAISMGYVIVSSQPVGANLKVRVLSSENPMGRGTPVEPGLEDGYMAVMTQIGGDVRV